MIDQFLDEKFAKYPQTAAFMDLKISMSDDLHDLANEKIAGGLSVENAEKQVIDRIEGLDDLLASLDAQAPNFTKQIANYQRFYNTLNQLEMVNKYQTDLTGIDEIHFNFRIGSILVIPSTSDKVVVHEYMSRKIDGLFSSPAKIGNVLNVNQGPKRLVGILRERIEIAIPNEFKGFISFNVNGSKLSLNNLNAEYLLDLTSKTTNVNLFKISAKKIQLDVGSGNLKAGSIDANDMAVNAKSGNIKLGKITIHESGKQLAVTSKNGNLTLQDVKTPFLRLRLQSGNTKIDNLTAPDIDAESTSGNLTANNLTGAGYFSLTSGLITLNQFQPTGDINMTVKSGFVRINLLETGDYQFDLQTKSGRMQLPSYAKITDFSNNKISGVSGINPEIKFSVKSNSGNIKIN